MFPSFALRRFSGPRCNVSTIFAVGGQFVMMVNRLMVKYVHFCCSSCRLNVSGSYLPVFCKSCHGQSPDFCTKTPQYPPGSVVACCANFSKALDDLDHAVRSSRQYLVETFGDEFILPNVHSGLHFRELVQMYTVLRNVWTAAGGHIDNVN